VTKGINEYIADDFLKRTVDLERLSAGQRKLAIKELKTLEKSLQAALTAENITSWKAARLEALLTQTKASIAKTYKRLSKEQKSVLEEVAADEAKFAAATVNSHIGASVMTVQTNAAQMRRLVDGTLINGAPSAAWWNGQAVDLQRKFEGNVRAGYLAGYSSQKIARAIRPIMNNSRAQAEALVRTSIQAVSNKAARTVMEENADVVKGVQQISTLDTRTTPICISYSDLVWDMRHTENGIVYTPRGHDKPFVNVDASGAIHDGPPRHWQCRSKLVPVTKTWDELAGKKIENAEGKETTYQTEFEKSLKAKGKTPEEIKKIKAHQRASMDGQVNRDIGFDKWLQGQPERVQIDTLGKGKWELWKKGKLPDLKSLTDQSGRPLTLKELQAKYGEAKPKPEPKPEPKPKPKPKPKPEPKPKPKPEPKPEPIAPPGTPDNAKTYINDSFKDSNLKIKRVVSKTTPLKELKISPTENDKDAYYSAKDRKIVLGNKPGQWGNHPAVFRHEYGHHTDAMRGLELLADTEDSNMRYASVLLDDVRKKEAEKILKHWNETSKNNFISGPEFKWARTLESFEEQGRDTQERMLSMLYGDDIYNPELFHILNKCKDEDMRKVGWIAQRVKQLKLTINNNYREINELIAEGKQLNIAAAKTAKKQWIDILREEQDGFKKLELMEEAIAEKDFPFTNNEMKLFNQGIEGRSQLIQAIKDKDVNSFLRHLDIQDNEIPHYSQMAIKDYFEAMTTAKLPEAMGHGASYYKRGERTSLTGKKRNILCNTEMVGEYFCLAGNGRYGETYKKALHYFAPETTKALERLFGL